MNNQITLAKKELVKKGLNPKNFTFTIKKSVTGHQVVASRIGTQESWTALFFK